MHDKDSELSQMESNLPEELEIQRIKDKIKGELHLNSDAQNEVAQIIEATERLRQGKDWRQDLEDSEMLDHSE